MSKKAKTISVMICLVHNNDKYRLDAIRPNIELLSTTLSKKYNVEKKEISYQSKITPHNLWLCVAKDLTQRRLERQWCHYRLISPPTLLRHVQYLLALFIKYVGFNKDMRRRIQRSSAIETIVSDKHIRSWNLFNESKCDFIIVFEDDAVFDRNSIDKLIMCMERVSPTSKEDMYLYVDLAGGCSITDLKISNLSLGVLNGIIDYKKPVTNTACGYLVNRVLIERFIYLITKRPSYRLIAVDWMMNKLLIESDGVLPTQCFHFDPPALEHGSVTGKFQAWKR